MVKEVVIPVRSQVNRVSLYNSSGGHHALIARHREHVSAQRAPGLSNRGRPWSSGFAINLVHQGRGVYHDEHGRKTPLGPGSVFFRFPDQTHTTVIEAEDYCESWLVIRPREFLHFRGLGFADTRRPVVRLAHPDIAEGVIRFCCEQPAAPQTQGPEAWARVCSQIVSLLAHIQGEVSAQVNEPEWLVQARWYLVQDLDQCVALAAVATRLGMSEQRFRKRFAEAVGLPPMAYRIRARIDRARCELLLHSVETVAQQLGFGDPKHFSRQFRNHTGMSPRDFQRLGRQQLPSQRREPPSTAAIAYATASAPPQPASPSTFSPMR